MEVHPLVIPGRVLNCILFCFILVQCSAPDKKAEEAQTDSLTTAPVVADSSVAVEEEMGEPTYMTLDLDEFAKDPFTSDYPEVKKTLRENGILFSIIAEDTVHSEYRTILFDSSRIEFLDSDNNQDIVGDLICSADIQSPKFYFNQLVAIGMTEINFFERAGLSKAKLIEDKASGSSYYEHSVPFGEDGYWRVVFWFKGGLLTRIQYSIDPCHIEYDS